MSEPAHRLAAMLVLAGSVRQSTFEQSVGRSLLNLPVRADKDVLDLWIELASEISARLTIDELALRVVVGSTSHIPKVRKAPGVAISVETDPVELRGPGGVIADIAAMYRPDDCVLVVSGSQLPILSLESLAEDLLERPGDVVVWTHPDGTPVTMYRIRAGVLAKTPGLGYLDFKEQMLPKLAGDHDVRVARLENRGVVPIRTWKDYLAGLRHLYRGQTKTHLSARLGRWDDPWQPVFGIVEYGASVAGSVDLFDAVVLAGASVDDHAILVRSVVCPGAVISQGETVSDEVVTPGMRPR